jgi:hypothetical protein
MVDNAEADSTISRFLVTLVVSVVIGLIVFTLFCILRSIFRSFYHPRIDAPRYSRIPFFWLWQSMRLSHNKLLITHGLDTVMHLRFVELLLALTVIMSLNLAILIPVNTVGDNKSRDGDDVEKTSGLNILTMANIDPENASLAAHIVMTITMSLACWAGAWWLYRLYLVDRRNVWFSRRDAMAHTLLFREVPAKLQDEGALREWLERWYPIAVEGVHVVRKTFSFNRKRAAYRKAVTKLETAQWKFDNDKKGRRPTTRTGPLNLIGKKVDAIDYWTEQRDTLEALINDKLSDQEQFKTTKSAFVTFNSTFPVRTQHHPRMSLNAMSAQPAPEPEDVLWFSLRVTRLSHTIRTILVWAFLFVLVFFWSVLIAFALSFANIGNLSKLGFLDWLDWIINTSPVVRGIIEGVIPALLVTIFLLLVPKIITLATWLQGQVSYSEWMSRVFTRFYIFLFVNVLLVASLSGGLFTVIQNAIDSPSSIPQLLAQTLPQQSTFFITFVMIQAARKGPMGILRILPFIIWCIKRKFLAKSPREIYNVNSPPKYNFATAAADQLLIFTIVLVYNVMAPLIVAFGIAYFVVVYIVERHNLVFVFKNRYQGGGLIWQSQFHMFMVAVITFQLVMVGLLGLNKFVAGIAIVPLPFISLLVWYFIYVQFDRLGRWGPIEDAPSKTWVARCKAKARLFEGDEMDVISGKDEDGDEKQSLHGGQGMATAYRQPAFVPIDEEVDEYLAANEIDKGVREQEGAAARVADRERRGDRQQGEGLGA